MKKEKQEILQLLGDMIYDESVIVEDNDIIIRDDKLELIFDTIFIKVLKKVCDIEWTEKSSAEFVKVSIIKEKAKELYNIII